MSLNSVYNNGGIIGQTLDLGSIEQYITGTTPGTPTYVGEASTGGTGVLFLTGITGLQQGDLVVFCVASGHVGITLESSGWTTALYEADGVAATLIAYKVMGATVDSSVEVSGGTTNTAFALTATAWRGAEFTSVSSVVTASSTTIDPPSVTATDNNSAVLVFSSIDDDVSTISSAPTGYTIGPEASYNISTFRTSAAQMYKTGVSTGTEDPSSLTWSSADDLEARTILLSPGTVNTFGSLKNSGIWNLNAVHDLLNIPIISEITYGTINGVTQPEGNLSISYPSGISSGDLLIFVFGCDGAAAPTFPSGWTTDASFTQSDSQQFQDFYIFSKIADGTETGSITVSNLNQDDEAHVGQIFRLKPSTTATFTFNGYDTGNDTTTEVAPAEIGSATQNFYIYFAFANISSTQTSAPANMTESGIWAGAEGGDAWIYYGQDIGGQSFASNNYSGNVVTTVFHYYIS